MRETLINKKRDFPVSLKVLVFTVVTSILGMILLYFFGETFFLDNIALNPLRVFSGKSIWTLLTSMLVHGSIFHLLANMFSLFFIGPFLEKIIGKKRFLIVYILSGILGGIFYVTSAFIFGDPSISAAGASGALFGILGVLSTLTPHYKIQLIVGPLILILFQTIISPFLTSPLLDIFGILVNLVFFLMLFSMFSFNSKFRKLAFPLELKMWILPIVAIVPLVIIGLFVPLPIGNSAHLGGLVLGIIYGLYLRKKYPNKTKIISRQFGG